MTFQSCFLEEYKFESSNGEEGEILAVMKIEIRKNMKECGNTLINAHVSSMMNCHQ
jgi:uncharacterized protein YehS (DUF1456 family)